MLHADSSTKMIYLQSLTQTELAQLLEPLGGSSRLTPQVRAKQIFQWVYKRLITDWNQMTDLSQQLREWLKANVVIYRLKEHRIQEAQDGTHKFLWELEDHKTIESVIIPAESRLTACISSQVGCAMACRFCLTGVQGLDRHLAVHEIVTQVFELRLRAPTLSNIVFMGMGEPLHNFDNVVKACRILLEPNGLYFSKRKITISTSGLVPAIEALGKELDVSLAISLNATLDEQRSQIMPVNKKWNISKLMQTCRELPKRSHRKITFEYVLLKNFNDTLEDADRIIQITRGIPCKINLIPFNEHSGSEYKRPSDETVLRFQKRLIDREMIATIRTSRGRDILAACGQLRSFLGTARGTERHRDWSASTPAMNTTTL